MRQASIRKWLTVSSVVLGLLVLGGCGSSDATRSSADAGEDEIDYGYGTQKKKDATGSAASVSGDEVSEQDRSATDLHELLQGNVSGVQVFRTADGGVRVQIRGPQSFLRASDPLYIVDGTPVQPAADGRFPWVEPSNIESITVLKGSEASIYGSRGANGVIVIRTKK